jgi:very-short-patch-repair endonuclease
MDTKLDRYKPKKPDYILDMARKMRQKPTVAEETLWQALRRKQIGGLTFKRQAPVGRFILDFYCAPQRLAVEIDGSSHQGKKEYDDHRSRLLDSCGIRILHFTNQDVIYHLDNVIKTITAASSQTHLPPRLLTGEGGRGRGCQKSTTVFPLFPRPG